MESFNAFKASSLIEASAWEDDGDLGLLGDFPKLEELGDLGRDDLLFDFPLFLECPGMMGMFLASLFPAAL